MRTTLKAIRARTPELSGGAAANGPDSGAGGNRPRVGPLSTTSEYDARKPRPIRTFGTVLLWLVMAALVAAGGLAGGVWLFLEDTIDAVKPISPDVIAAKPSLVEVADDPTAPAIVLVIGYDARQGPDGFDEARSDTIMLLRADPNRDTLTMLSFPRDLSTAHPGCKARSAWTGKLNEAYLHCGAVGILESVQALTGLEINYLMTVNFAAFKQMVAKAGGVYIDVDQRYFNSNDGPGGYALIDLHPGYQKLSGQQALDYARYRHGDNDLIRNLRQQAFVKAFKQRIGSSVSVTSFPGFVGALHNNVEVQQGGKKDISSDVVLRYSRFLYELADGGFYQVKVDQDSVSENRTTGDLFLSDDAVAANVAEFVTPDVDAAANAADVAVGKRLPTIKPANVTIQVVNGNAVEGSAADAAERLRQRSYQAESVGDADNFAYFDTVVQFNPTVNRAKGAAQKVAALFDGVVQPRPEGVIFDSTLRVVVGKTYHKAIAPGGADQTPDKAAADVESTIDEIRPLMAEAQQRVEMPVYAPRVKARLSRLAAQEPVRAYRVAGHDAVSTQYLISGIKYWGFMQTSWLDAPILNEPSVEREYKDRTYRLYFSGPRLSMVAFEENDTVLWVRNTLDQQLTNETMLELADGLRSADTAP
jgi:LCP family protein required for cell wall assembly